MHFRPSDQAYWVVACHKARRKNLTYLTPRRSARGKPASGAGAPPSAAQLAKHRMSWLFDLLRAPWDLLRAGGAPLLSGGVPGSPSLGLVRGVWVPGCFLR